MAALNDTSFRAALDMWFSNQDEAVRTYGQISKWDTSAVTDMNNAFRDKTNFNEDISKWNTSVVTTMSAMFQSASNFNQDISSWNISGVLTMGFMFLGATLFNNGGAPLATNGEKWNTSKIMDMSAMFYGATNFNQNISSWNTSEVLTMGFMFNEATHFNNGGATLATASGKWNTSNVINMMGMFSGATVFKGEGLDTWSFAATKPNIQTMFIRSGVPNSVNNGKIWNAWQLKGYSTTDLTNANLNPPTERSISVVSGWNLIGTTQYLVLTNRVNIQYIYGLSGGSFQLITDNQLVPGGYWLYWNAPNGTISTEEFQTESRAIGVVSGWNLIGSTVDMQITSDLSNIQYIYGLQNGSFKLMTSNLVLIAGGYWLYWNDASAGAISITV